MVALNSLPDDEHEEKVDGVVIVPQRRRQRTPDWLLALGGWGIIGLSLIGWFLKGVVWFATEWTWEFPTEKAKKWSILWLLYWGAVATMLAVSIGFLGATTVNSYNYFVDYGHQKVDIFYVSPTSTDTGVWIRGQR